MAKKKGLMTRLIVGSEKDEEYVKSTLPTNRWELFWDTIKGNFWKLFGTNLLILIPLIPTFFLIILNLSTKTSYGELGPFSSGFGVGYPVVPDMTGAGEELILLSDLRVLAFLPLSMLLASLGLAGGGYVIRNLSWGEGVAVGRDYLHGIKSNYFTVLLTLVLYTALLYFNILLNDYLEMVEAVGVLPTWLCVISHVALYAVLAILTLMALFMYSMGVTYELKFGALVKNAFILTLAYLPGSVVLALAAALPYLILLIGNLFLFLGLFVIFLIGCSFTVLVWTVYSNWVFDETINKMLPSENRRRGLYDKKKRVDDKELGRYKAKKEYYSSFGTRPIKPIDDDIAIDSLPESFSRADLARLAEQKEVMKKDSEAYEKEHYNDEEYVRAREALKAENTKENMQESELDVILAELEGKKKPKKKQKKGKR